MINHSKNTSEKELLLEEPEVFKALARSSRLQTMTDLELSTRKSSRRL